MMDTDLPLDDLSELARRLGQRGGRQTKRRGLAYYARIGRLGAQRRWHPEDDEGIRADRAASDHSGSSSSPEADVG